MGDNQHNSQLSHILSKALKIIDISPSRQLTGIKVISTLVLPLMALIAYFPTNLGIEVPTTPTTQVGRLSTLILLLVLQDR